MCSADLDHGNDCSIRWNATLQRAEVWSDHWVAVNKELGTAYHQSYWYRVNNGVVTKATARHIRDYYQMDHLPWYAEQDADPQRCMKALRSVM